MILYFFKKAQMPRGSIKKSKQNELYSQRATSLKKVTQRATSAKMQIHMA